MGFAFPNVTVGKPAACSGLTVFPLFLAGGRGIDYLLAPEAIESGLVVVEELGEQGSVPELVVTNDADRPVLFLEGDELVGAKQNRVVNATILVPAKSRTVIPVSCVEQGRWRYLNRSFTPGRHTSPHLLRHVLRASVSRSLREDRSLRSDQGEVWDEVARHQASLGTSSPTGAMADTFAAHRDHLEACRENLAYAEGAHGLAIGIGDRIASFDLFDQPRTCRRVWDRILAGATLAALEREEPESRPGPEEVERLLREAAELVWEAFESVGAGSQYRTESGRGDQGAALVLDEVVVHGSVVARC